MRSSVYLVTWKLNVESFMKHKTILKSVSVNEGVFDQGWSSLTEALNAGHQSVGLKWSKPEIQEEDGFTENVEYENDHFKKLYGTNSRWQEERYASG